MDHDPTPHIDQILHFWFGDLDGAYDVDRAKNQLWWKGTPAIDAEVTDRFGDLVHAACEGKLDSWAETARGSLALVILLDQLTRNVFRGSARAYAGDARAVDICSGAVATGADRELRLIERSFLYMPLMHAEDRRVAEQSLAQFEGLSKEIAAAPRDDHPDFLSSAKRHADIVMQFGRYPHRNELLERDTTQDERDFLDAGGPTFGQKKAEP